MSKLDTQLENVTDVISSFTPVSKSTIANAFTLIHTLIMKYTYTPSLKELRSSWKLRLREYLLENSLHGVPYFVDSSRPKWERLTWLFLTMASLVAVGAIIVIILMKFQTDPTITGLDIMTEHIKIDFPQVHICFDWEVLNHSYINKDEMRMYAHMYNWTFGKDIDLASLDPIYYNENSFHKTFEMMAPECDYIITDCAYRGINVSCNKLFKKMLTPVGACCNTKNLEPLRIIDLSWNLQFRIPTSIFPLRFYFTEYNDSGPRPGERSIIKAYFPVDIEFIVDITYTTSDIRYLLLRQRKCYFNHERITFNDCENNCLANRLFKRCNCLPWFLSFIDKKECSLKKYHCLNKVAVDKIQCDCWLPCDHTACSVKGIRKSSTHVNRIMLRNWPTALYKREMRFGYFDLLVSFGGIASLFLGYSLLTSVEFGYYFSLRTYCGAVVESSRKQYNIMTVYVVKKTPPKVNHNPTYYQYID